MGRLSIRAAFSKEAFSLLCSVEIDRVDGLEEDRDTRFRVARQSKLRVAKNSGGEIT
jgi:hypothetical protein